MFNPSKSQILSPHLLYISGRDFILKTQPLRHRMSREGHRHFLFIVPLKDHYASVQIRVVPFHLECHPGQLFYSSSAHYKLCCQDAKAVDFSDALRGTAQQVYNSSFCLQTWNFSSPDCWKEDGAGVLSHEVNKSCLESAVKNIEKFFLPYLPEGIQIPIKSKDNNGDNSSYRKKRIRKALEQSSEAVNGLPPNSKRVCSERRRARPPVENSERSQALTPAENSERSLALTPAENSERSLALTPAENSERSQALTLADNVVEDGASKELWSVLALDEDIGKLDAVERFQSLLQFESKAVGMVNVCQYISTCIFLIYARSQNLGEKQAKSFFMAEMKKAGVSENRKSSYRRHQEVVLVSRILASLPEGGITYQFLELFFQDSTYAVIRAALRKDRDGRYGDEEAYVSDFLGELESYKGDKRIGQQPFDLLGFFERVFPNTTREEICDAISFHSILGSEPRLAVSTTAEVSESGNADILSRNEPELPSGSSSPNAQPTSGSSNDRESQKDSTQPGQDAVEKNSRLPTPLPDSDDTELPFNLAFDPTAPFNHPFDPTHNDPQPFNLAFDFNDFRI